MRKLGVEEWIINIVKAMYANANSKVRVNGSYSAPFEVKVGVHQGSVLSPLLFIIVLEALSMEFRTSTPWELLYADDLVIIAESLDELVQKIELWKNGMEAKGLRVNMPKTKVMICEADSNPLKKSGKYPCGVCRSGVGSNSIYCSTCSHWVHKACSGIKGRLKPDPEFTCSRCLGLARPINVQLIKNISIGEDTLDVESSFCYLGDMVSQGGGCLDGITTRIRCAWGKFRELLPLFTSSYIPLKKKGEMFCIYIRNVLLHASECWAPTASDLSRIQRCDRSMSRWICKVKWSDRVSSVSLLEKLMIPSIESVLSERRLRWYGHVKRNSGSINNALCFEAPGRRGRGRPKKTWLETVRNDIKNWNMPASPENRIEWRSTMKLVMQTCNPHIGGK